MVAELQRALTELGLEQYLPNCLRAGIQNWQSLTTITEAELAALGVRIGHRRKLQRAIARGHLWPDNRPLPTPEQLQQHRQNLRRLARGDIDPEILEETYYTVASSAQSPWSRETASSNDTDGSGERLQDGTSHRVTDVLRTSSRLFPITVSDHTDSAWSVASEGLIATYRQRQDIKARKDFSSTALLRRLWA